MRIKYGKGTFLFLEALISANIGNDVAEALIRHCGSLNQEL